MISWLTLITTAVLALPAPHEFPLGHVERSVNAVVRGRQLDVEYAIGLSDETARQLFPMAFADSLPALENDHSNPSGSSLLTNDVSQPEGAIDLETNQTIADSEDADQSTRLENEADVLRKLQGFCGDEILGNLELICNGQCVALEVIDVTPSPRHHVSISIRFRAQLPDAKVINFEFHDRNFVTTTKTRTLSKTESDSNTGVPEDSANSDARSSELQVGVDKNVEKDEFVSTGAVKLALRAKGDTILLQSNVAPVLARAKPIDLNGLDEVSCLEACTIVARIGFVSSDKNKPN